MTENTKENILSQIDDLVSKATFSLDAVESVNKLKADLSVIQQRNELLEKRTEILQNESNNKSNTIDVLRDELRDCKTRIKDLEEHKAKADKAIYDAEKYLEVSKTWEKAMGIVFKPSQVREMVYGSNSSNTNGGMMTSTTNNSTVVRDFE